MRKPLGLWGQESPQTQQSSRRPQHLTAIASKNRHPCLLLASFPVYGQLQPRAPWGTSGPGLWPLSCLLCPVASSGAALPCSEHFLILMSSRVSEWKVWLLREVWLSVTPEWGGYGGTQVQLTLPDVPLPALDKQPGQALAVHRDLSLWPSES